METIADRTRRLIESEKLNEYSFSKRIGKSNTAVTKIVRGESKPGYEMLESIFQEFPNLSREWYLEGNGEMWKQTQSKSLEPSESYLREHLIKLEESFALLSAQFRSQLESKDTQIAGLQRTVDALLGKSFLEPASETGRVIPLHSPKKKEKVG